ncbi:hypothetical protein H2199_005298 [Coniosporium tulheliwenetii]|uniref:Uncharacterized protein n=1 Tax=Coniosporium tulheliwenetii TaxID=3383036 RepID=A0ACC2Z0V7_9PEZI|nr:hypothetical protein H2199_005298 [Cladosporium sp. JES 115]
MSTVSSAPSSASATRGSDEHHTPVAAIVGGAAGGAFGLGIIVGLIIWRMKVHASKSRRSGSAALDDHISPTASSMQDTHQYLPAMSELPSDPDPSKRRKALPPRYSTLSDQANTLHTSSHTKLTAAVYELPLTEPHTTSPISRKTVPSRFSSPSSSSDTPALDTTEPSSPTPSSPYRTQAQDAREVLVPGRHGAEKPGAGVGVGEGMVSPMSDAAAAASSPGAAHLDGEVLQGHWTAEGRAGDREI